MLVRLLHGDCMVRMAEMEAESVGVVCCDPPYGLEFMGKDWDNLAGDKPPGYTETPRFLGKHGHGKFAETAPNFYLGGQRAQDWHAQWLSQVYRVLERGGRAKVFGGSRVYHRLAAAMEEVGFVDIQLESWTYGSGFPKSLNVGKAIDKRAFDTFKEEVRGHLRTWKQERGLTNTEINAALGFAINGSGMAYHWTSTSGGDFSLPTKDNWFALKALMGWPDCEMDSLYEKVRRGADRPVTGWASGGIAGGTGEHGGVGGSWGYQESYAVTASASAPARVWEGWGTALKPAWEPVLIGVKP